MLIESGSPASPQPSVYMPPLQPTFAVSCCPHPFEQRRIDYAVPVGLTIAEIIELIQPDPLLRMHGVAFLGEQAVERAQWHRVRPKPGTYVSIRLLPAGGGGWRIAAMVGIAIIAVVTTALTYGALAPVWGTTAAAIAGGLAGAAVTLGGTLLVNTFLPPPVPELSKDKGTESQTYQILGARNRIDIWGKVPFLCGRFRLTPPYAAAPYREVVGSNTWWRAIFAISHGPVHVESMRIGETPIGNYAEVEWQLRRGYWSMPDKGAWDPASGVFPANPGFGDTWTATSSGTVNGLAIVAGQTITFNRLADPSSAAAWDLDQGQPFSLYPSDVFEDPLSVALTYAAGGQVRTTVPGADEIAIEIAFERLVHIQNQPAGKKSDQSVTFRIEQSPGGENHWSTVLVRTVTGRQQTPLYWGHRWRPAEYGAVDDNSSYDVRITRLSGDTDEERNFSKCFWTALRTITAGDPVPVPGITLIAVRIRATGQLQGTIDEFNVTARTIARDWDASTDSWVWRPTSSPAALFRHILQHPSRRKPATDAQIDLDRLTYWDGVTRPSGREFNGVFDAKTSLYDALTRIARLGRAMVSLRDLKFSVVIDEPRTVPVRMFTPRNSWTYEGEMTHEPAPHGYRIAFVNEQADWKTEEVVVYDDSYSAANATLIDRVEIVGLTSRDQTWKEGRYHLAQQRLRREIHRINCDFEQLACERGDLVALQHDVIATGLASARIAATSEDAAGNVTDVTLDAPVTMLTGKSYGLRVRRVIAGAMRTDLYPLRTIAGFSPRLFFTNPPALIDAPAAGDLCAFGELGRETLRVLVRDIEPGENLSAKLTLIAEAPGVHTAEQGPIPPYDPVVTPPPAVPAPVVLDIRSDERVMLVTPSRTLIERVVFQLEPIAIEGAVIHVLYRVSGTQGPWQDATVQEETATGVVITGPQSGETCDFRLQYTHPNHLASPATQVNSHYVTGRRSPPADLQNLTLAVVGGSALLRWDLPADLDVQFGGWISFRHSPEMDAMLWPNSTSLARAVTGDQTHVFLPLKPGTYFARVYDADGRPSEGVAFVSTKQASLLAFSPVGSVEEDPAFVGTKTRCTVVDDGLMLDAEDFDAVPDVDALTNWDDTGGVAGSGLYQFAAGIDAGSVRRLRLTSRLKLDAVNQFEFWDARIGAIDDWPDVDGTLGASVDASIWGRLTDDDPAGSPSWGALMRIDSAEIDARAIGQIECRMRSDDRLFNLWITQLRVLADEVM